MVDAKLKGKYSLVKTICSALVRDVADVAQNVIKQPDILLPLMTCHDCDYAIHALLITLTNENCLSILNKMSGEKVSVLKRLVVKAKELPQPNYAMYTQTSKDRYDIGQLHLTEYKQLENELVRLSAIIAKEVSTLWDDAVLELNRWNDEIEKYMHVVPAAVIADAEKMQKPEIDIEPKLHKSEKTMIVPDDNHWTLEQLMERLGITYTKFRNLKYRLLRGKPTLKKQVESWFVFSSGKGGTAVKLFKVEYLNDLKKLFGLQKVDNVKSQNVIPDDKEEAVKKEEQQSKRKIKTRDIKSKTIKMKSDDVESAFVESVVLKQPAGQLDLNSLDVYLDKLQQMLLVVCSEQKDAEKQSIELRKQADEAQVAAEKAKASADALRQKIDVVNVLMQEQKQAKEALNNAQKLFDDANAKIANLLQSVNVDVK